MSLTSVTQALSHIDAITGPASATMSPTAGPAAVATAAVPVPATTEISDTPAMPVMPVIGAVDAASARTAHIRLKARATAAQRATRTGTDMDTNERITERL